MMEFQPIERIEFDGTLPEDEAFAEDVDVPRLTEAELGIDDVRPDPFDPRTAVDPELASAEEVIGMAGGPDPFRQTTRREQITITDPLTRGGMEYF